MDKIVFNDRLVIKTLTDGVIKEFGSDFYSNYVDASIKAAKSVEWKTKGMAIVTPVSEAVTNTAIASVLFIIAWDAV